jgi:acyl carrier protein
MALSRDEIFSKVQAVLVDALGVDEEEVTPTAVIKDDLGAESIDFLDISFRLEKAFGIKIQKGEMMPEGMANDATLVADGKITEAGVALLKKQMPHSDLSEFTPGTDIEKMSRLFTVDAIVNFVENKLKAA